jgi:AraC-like DNA-binding protein
MSELKDSGVMIRLAYKAMKNAGIDVSALLAKLGIDESYLKMAQLRTPHEAQSAFWDYLQQLTSDQDIGLHLGQHLPVFKGQVLEYLFLSSPTFGEGLKRALNYQRLISDAANSELVIDDNRCYLRVNSASSEIRNLRHFNECFAQGLIAFFKSITEDRFKPSLVYFVHAKPENWEEVTEVLGCEVQFGQEENRLYFDRSVLELDSPHAEPELLQLHEQLAIDQVARLEKEDVVAQVNKIVAELLDSGEVSLDAVSSRLDMSPRSLRTRLSELDTNFNQILADYRYKLARRLLAKTDESIDEIVYLTGFSEPSTFYRAFKRWSGKTPIEYRKERKEKYNQAAS